MGSKRQTVAVQPFNAGVLIPWPEKEPTVADHFTLASIFVALQLLRLKPGLQNGWHWWEEYVGGSLSLQLNVDRCACLFHRTIPDERTESAEPTQCLKLK